MTVRRGWGGGCCVGGGGDGGGKWGRSFITKGRREWERHGDKVVTNDMGTIFTTSLCF